LISNYLNKSGMTLFRKPTVQAKKDGSNGFKKSIIPASGDDISQKKTTASFMEG